MSSKDIEEHHESKIRNREKEVRLINGDSVKALEIGRRNFFLKGADLHAAKQGKHFLLFKDKK